MKHSTISIIAVAIWLSMTLGGTWAMLVYANAPGEGGSSPVNWPEASRLPRPVHKSTLVIFVHPHCSCSRASLGELALLMAHCEGKVEARAVFLAATGTDMTWPETDLWRSAAAIPGVAMVRDDDGREARTFGIATSGTTLLYDDDGRLLFRGGITLARGHAGDNPGRGTIEALLNGGTTQRAGTPVFGCAIFGKKKEAKTCQR